jgi:hypothetical protein
MSWICPKFDVCYHLKSYEGCGNARPHEYTPSCQQFCHNFASNFEKGVPCIEITEKQEVLLRMTGKLYESVE